MKSYDGQRLTRLFDQRWGSLGDWRNRWEEISFYILPQQRSFSTSWSPGADRNENRVYDSTAIEANERLATRMHEALTSPASIWFRLGFENSTLDNNDAAREWLDDCEKRIRVALAASNFDAIMGQMYLDLGALGSAAINCDEKPPEYGEDSLTVFNGLMFQQMHLEGVACAENAAGSVDDIMYRFNMTAEQCYQKWDDKAPKRALEAMEQGKPDTEIKVVLCRFKRYLDQKPEGLLQPQERPWAAVWVDMHTKEIIEDGGSYERSSFLARWRSRSLEIMGYGPGQRALPTVRTINEAERLELAAWAKVIDPPLKTTANNVVGDVDLRAAGITVVRKMEDLDQWNLRPDINHHMIQLEDKRYQVREIFRYHSLELPPREQVGEMTAYEVAKRVEQVYRALGPTVVQMQADILNPLMQRVFGIMYRKGALMPVPQVLENQPLNVTYVGPMALAQKATEIEAMDRFVADALALAQSGYPDALDIVDFDQMQRYKAKLMGVPAIVTRSTEEVIEIRAERQAEMEQMQAQETALKNSQSMANMSQAVGQDVMTDALGRMGEDALAT
jgi:hypothetical protein